MEINNIHYYHKTSFCKISIQIYAKKCFESLLTKGAKQVDHFAVCYSVSFLSNQLANYTVLKPKCCFAHTLQVNPTELFARFHSSGSFFFFVGKGTYLFIHLFDEKVVEQTPDLGNPEQTSQATEHKMCAGCVMWEKHFSTNAVYGKCQA